MKSYYTEDAARGGSLSQQVQAADTPPDLSQYRVVPD